MLVIIESKEFDCDRHLTGTEKAVREGNNGAEDLTQLVRPINGYLSVVPAGATDHPLQQRSSKLVKQVYLIRPLIMIGWGMEAAASEGKFGAVVVEIAYFTSTPRVKIEKAGPLYLVSSKGAENDKVLNLAFHLPCIDTPYPRSVKMGCGDGAVATAVQELIDYNLLDSEPPLFVTKILSDESELLSDDHRQAVQSSWEGLKFLLEVPVQLYYQGLEVIPSGFNKPERSEEMSESEAVRRENDLARALRISASPVPSAGGAPPPPQRPRIKSEETVVGNSWEPMLCS
jgi:hypothetical protein